MKRERERSETRWVPPSSFLYFRSVHPEDVFGLSFVRLILMHATLAFCAESGHGPHIAIVWCCGSSAL